MAHASQHTFHIPVMGTAFSIDTPIKVARYGISSVMSIGDDELCEQMRRFYCEKIGETYVPIKRQDEDYRARRITAYLNLVDRIVAGQMKELRASAFEPGSEITHYFELLPETAPLKKRYLHMLETADSAAKKKIQEEIRAQVVPGSLDVNIMTKIDRDPLPHNGVELPEEYSDAISALRGFANSTLHAAIKFSAGFNRRLYGYLEKLPDFFPDEKGHLKKRVLLKVSDYRSSLTQGKFLAKKGIWIAEHRIESGLNCGGHAFATEGYLFGPILEEFKANRQYMREFLFEMCQQALKDKGRTLFPAEPEMRITVQGGIGTYKEDRFLIDFYGMDGTGWATPFLLVPEVTNVDPETREQLAAATKDDLFLSDYSPLGVPFNTFRNSQSDEQKWERVAEGKPGSPCPKGHLVSNTDYTEKPICLASSAYQTLRIKELKSQNLSPEEYAEAFRRVIIKSCLCEDLAAPVLIDKQIPFKRPKKSTVCPGPNLAYFSRICSKEEMIGHIYGRTNVLNDTYRPNIFINELKLYIDYLEREIGKCGLTLTPKQTQRFTEYLKNLREGIAYYRTLIPKMINETAEYRANMNRDLELLNDQLEDYVRSNRYAFGESIPPVLA